MPVYTDPMALLRKQETLFAAVEHKVRGMHREFVVREAEAFKREILSGPITTKELRRMGHPFARKRMSRRGFERTAMKGGQRLSVKMRHGVVPTVGIAIPRLPINKQSGRLRSGVRLNPVSTHPLSYEIGVGQVPYAKYILSPKGTKKMVPRGVKAAQLKRAKAANKVFSAQLSHYTLTAAVRGRA